MAEDNANSGSDNDELTPQDLLLQLSEADSVALDALIDAQLNIEAVPAELQIRAMKIGAILGLLASDATADSMLKEVTIQRILRARETDSLSSGPRLSSMDEEAVDALVLARFDLSGTPGALQDRAGKVAAIGELLVANREKAPVDLVARTLARIDASEAKLAPISIDRGGVFARWKIGDLVGVAAALLVCSAVAWPIVSASRANSTKYACQSNMQTVAHAMGAYAKSFRDDMPMATASLGGRWWDVGSDAATSNSANLFTLARAGFARVQDMACPGNPHAVTHEGESGSKDWKKLDDVSYSYQIMFGPHRPMWNHPSAMVVVADRSPVVLRAVRNEAIFPEESSPNHRGYGQDAMFVDGHVAWMTTPVLPNGDNIWLPRPIEEIIRRVRSGETSGIMRGTELPLANDVFLGP